MVHAVSQSWDALVSLLNLSILFNLIATIILAFAAYKLLTKLLETTTARMDIQRDKVEVLYTVIKIVIGALALIAILGSLQIDVTGLIAGVGIGALAVGFAAQTVIANLISGLFLIFERVFVQGDIIQVGTVTGEVVGIGFRTTQIQTVDGNVVTIPNATLATSEVINMTTGAQEILLTLEETIDIYADHDHAKHLMVEAIQETSGVVLDDNHQPVIVVTRNGATWSTTLKLFVTVAKDRWHVTQSTITETIKRKFDAATILPPVPAFARTRIEDIKNEVKITTMTGTDTGIESVT